jgi:hypothetical protein
MTEEERWKPLAEMAKNNGRSHGVLRPLGQLSTMVGSGRAPAVPEQY